MKLNKGALKGVVHPQKSTKNLTLTRYFPEVELAQLVEQFWLVKWDLELPHTQQNLPDPNFNLYFDGLELWLTGPVSKAYRYKMSNRGRIYGVKFNIGVLLPHLKSPIAYYIDKEVPVQQAIRHDLTALKSSLKNSKTDAQVIDRFHHYLLPLTSPTSGALSKVQSILTAIKTENRAQTMNVESLAEQNNMSVRSLQRQFHTYVGLTPKWLLRKYRLHQVMSRMDLTEKKIIQLAVELDYSDQSHLVRDFKDMLGFTPEQYLTDAYPEE